MKAVINDQRNQGIRGIQRKSWSWFGSLVGTKKPEEESEFFKSYGERLKSRNSGKPFSLSTCGQQGVERCG